MRTQEQGSVLLTNAGGGAAAIERIWTKINIECYSEPADAFFKALVE